MAKESVVRAGVKVAVLVGSWSWLAQAAQPESSNPWAAFAEADLRSMRDTLRAQHPGPVDVHNPGFNQWLEQGHARALERARRATSFEGWQHALKLYANGFRDAHLNVRFTVEPVKNRWPGWTVALREGRYVVTTAGAAPVRDAPAAGGELVSCDGRTPEVMLREDVLPYDGNPALEASRTAVAPLLFLDRGNPWRTLPERCTVREGGQEREVTLVWRTIDASEGRERVQAAAFGPPPPFAIRDFGTGGVWVSLPLFFGTTPEVQASLEAAVKQAPSWRGRSVIVFDVRGNNGGSSQWGANLLRGLYGADFEASLGEAEAKATQYVEWRVSPENQRYLASIEELVAQQFGKEAPVLERLRLARQGLAQAQARGETLWREPDGKAVAKSTAPGAVPNPVKGRVFVLTDGKCVSACLDFVEGALRFPGVTHVGLPTVADTPYMELRGERLPSGIAQFNFSIKVYRNNPRSGRPFVPVHRFSGDISDTAAVERWVLGLTGPSAPGAPARP
jgi:hypothetical protein